MAYWKTYGYKGQTLETLIEETHKIYKKNNIGLIEKIPTPIKVTKIESNGMISEGFFEKKSSVDFIGVLQGLSIAFDAKETKNKSLPLQNIHKHQIDFMLDFEKQKGYSFIICHYKTIDKYFLIPIQNIVDIINSNKKSINHEVLPKELEINYNKNKILDYIPALNNYIKTKT